MNARTDSNPAELTPGDIIVVLKQYRVLLVGIWIFCTVLAVVAALLATPVYRAEAQVAAAADSAAGGGDLSSLINRFSAVPGMGSIGRFSQRDTLTESLVTLRSPTFLIDFINTGSLKPLLFAKLWDAENQEWLVEDAAEIPTDEDAYVFFREELLSVTENKASPGIITVAIEWHDREQAAAWVNSLIAMLNERLRSVAIEEANRTIEYLNKELEKARIVEVRQAIFFMIENQINSRTVANVREEYALKVLSEAVAPDADHYIRPNRSFMVFIGFLIGLILGVFASFLLFAVRRLRTDALGDTSSR